MQLTHSFSTLLCLEDHKILCTRGNAGTRGKQRSKTSGKRKHFLSAGGRMQFEWPPPTGDWRERDGTGVREKRDMGWRTAKLEYQAVYLLIDSKPWKLSKIRGESLFPFPFPFLPLPVSFRRSYHRNLPLSPSGSYPVGTGLLSFIHSFHTHHFVPNYGSGIVLGSEAVKLKTDIISVLLELKVFSRGDWQKQADSQNNWKLE